MIPFLWRNQWTIWLEVIGSHISILETFVHLFSLWYFCFKLAAIAFTVKLAVLKLKDAYAALCNQRARDQSKDAKQSYSLGGEHFI